MTGSPRRKSVSWPTIAHVAALIASLFLLENAAAWTDHALLTHEALFQSPLVASQPMVPTETLESFVRAEAAKLPALLSAEDSWAATHLTHYQPVTRRPFVESPQNPPLVAQFLAAVRVNPNVQMVLFLQDLPGEPAGRQSKTPWTVVTTLRTETVAKEQTFSSIEPGSLVSPLDVITTASDEPDYGLDIGLWDDNGTAYGASYQFGTQPFGNPKLENTSQAPFHMGFYHESSLLYAAAPFLHRTYSLYRIHLYTALSRYAFSSGHPYWGWRFAGWGLHYVQDLTQPYHAKALPGVGMGKVIWASALDAVGIHGPKRDAIQLVSNRHLVLENYEYHRLRSAYAERRIDDRVLMALADTRGDGTYPRWTDDSPRDEVSLEANRSADELDSVLSEVMPPHLVSDPGYVFSESDPKIPNVFVLTGRQSHDAQARMEGEMVMLMQRAGVHTRRLVTYIRS